MSLNETKAGSSRRVAVLGAGWAGLTAAIGATQAGSPVTLFEAARTLGGRARGVEVGLPSGERLVLDNGQHVLLGAYQNSLTVMQTVGVDLHKAFECVPLDVRWPDGTGFQMGKGMAPWHVLKGVISARGWSMADKWSLIQKALVWRWQEFQCEPRLSVTDVCQGISARVMQTLIEPLCLSALNTAMHEASGAVFLRVLKDALWGAGFGGFAASQMLIPNDDLSTLFPNQAARWLQSKGAVLRLGERVHDVQALMDTFDHIVVATGPWDAATLLRPLVPAWAASVEALQYRAIATVYALAPKYFQLPRRMLALPSAHKQPAQFVFQRLEAPGLLAFVVSAAQGDRQSTEQQVLVQGERQLGVPLMRVATIMDKRATFACTAQSLRPASLGHPQISVVGDYVPGPYPSTIEGAVLSAMQHY